MKAGAVAVVCFLACVSVASAAEPPAWASDVTLFRVFLNNTDTTLVSYGEPTEVGGRVVFSMPIPSTTERMPQLQLVSIPADRVDWPRTKRYAEAARAARYLATRADDDFQQLSNDVAQALNDIGQTADVSAQLQIVERARQQLAGWPATHYDFKRSDVDGLVSYLDEVIAGLRLATGTGRFNLDLTTSTPSPVTPVEPLQPAPTLRDAIEQVLLASGMAPSAVERNGLLATALTELTRPGAGLPDEWAAAMASDVRTQIAQAVLVERQYQLVSQKITRMASELARVADVRGIVRLRAEADTRDEGLGRQRPDMMALLLSSIDLQLEAAQRLTLSREHWAARLPELRRYNRAIAPALETFAALTPPLDDIRALAGSTPATLATVTRLSADIIKRVSAMRPPVELESAHSLLLSAARLAANAGRLRGEAVSTGDITRAWDASSAAAGALMLASNAKNDVRAVLRTPQLP